MKYYKILYAKYVYVSKCLSCLISYVNVREIIRPVQLKGI